MSPLIGGDSREIGKNSDVSEICFPRCLRIQKCFLCDDVVPIGLNSGTLKRGKSSRHERVDGLCDRCRWQICKRLHKPLKVVQQANDLCNGCSQDCCEDDSRGGQCVQIELILGEFLGRLHSCPSGSEAAAMAAGMRLRMLATYRETNDRCPNRPLSLRFPDGQFPVSRAVRKASVG